VLEGKLIDNPAHIKRLHRSLGELNIASPATDNEILGIQRELIKRNNLHEGAIYLQVSRGSADRDFPFPANMLAQVLAKQAAIDAGAVDAWMVEDGFVTEGSSNNAFIVDADGKLITRQLGNEILHGITRASVIEMIEKENIVFEERAEAFITSASTLVWPVVDIDGTKIGDGEPGPLAPRLREFYIRNSLARSE